MHSGRIVGTRGFAVPREVLSADTMQVSAGTQEVSADSKMCPAKEGSPDTTEVSADTD